MTLLAIAIAAGLVAGRLLGGRPAGLGRVRLRLVPLAAGALAAQIGLGFASAGGAVPTVVRLPLLLGSDLAIGAFVVANLTRRPAGERTGLVLFGAGWASNLLAIALTGAMPVTPAGLRAAGLSHLDVARGHLGKHLLLHDPGGLPGLLGDSMGIALLRTVLSPGDLFMAAGLVVFLAAGSLRTLPPASTTSPPVPPNTAQSDRLATASDHGVADVAR